MNKYEELLASDVPVLIRVQFVDHYRKHARIRLLQKDGTKDMCRYMFSPEFKTEYSEALSSRSCFVPDLCRSRKTVVEEMQKYDEQQGLIILDIVEIK